MLQMIGARRAVDGRWYREENKHVMHSSGDIWKPVAPVAYQVIILEPVE